jgi:Ca2+-transporting ATPase
MEKQDVLKALQTQESGLSNVEAKNRLIKFGHNEIPEQKNFHILRMFSKQLKSPLVIVLLFATLISAIVGDAMEAIIIAAIVILSIIVGFVQEYRSEKAIESLKSMLAPSTQVLRENTIQVIRSRDLVIGDVMIISPGDRIQADAYLIESFNLQVDEAPLTGESFPVTKSAGVISRDAPLTDRPNILNMGTTVTNGRGKAVAFATGMSSELGKIATSVSSIKQSDTPLEIRIKRLGKQLCLIMLCVVGVVGLLAYLKGYEIIDLIIWTLSLAVAAVPEALPAVVTTALAIGAYKMARQNAIIRQLSSVETLGSTTIICVDKTGTLTKGEMSVRRIYFYDEFFNISGDNLPIKTENHEQDLSLFAKCSMLCNDVVIKTNEKNIEMLGDSTEVALMSFSKSIIKEKIDLSFPRINEVPFTSERKRMTTIHKSNGTYHVFMKGAVEIVLDLSSNVLDNGKTIPLDDNIRNKILDANESMAEKGLRVLALAYKEVLEIGNVEFIEKNMTLIGLVGIMDPPRTECYEAIKQCRTAGIDIIMLTGDHKITAKAIAEELGISNKENKILSGNELDKIDSPSLVKIIDTIKVYARISPEHKVKLVNALKQRGHTVAMTGDGINDAPALKSADIGIAMGLTGTQVAKESSSMVLADDNFATIVTAIKEGRRVFDNIKKFLIYLVSCNISEIAILAVSVAVGLPIPLLAKHLLYINLVTDGAPAIALGLEPAEPGVMQRKPHSIKNGPFHGTKKWLIGVPLILSSISLILFWHTLESSGGTSEYAVMKARTMVFGLMIFFQLFFAISCRSLSFNLTKLGLLKNKPLIISIIVESLIVLGVMTIPAIQDIFDIVPLTLMDWITILALATTGLIYSEFIKLRKFSSKSLN